MKLILALFVLLSPTLSTADSQTLLKAKTKEGKTMKLVFDEKPVTVAVETATLCVESKIEVTEAILWMPDRKHDHGSAPTSLGDSETKDCISINDIDFTMKGKWDVHIKFKDLDSGVFQVDVLLK